ncbi:methyl-accepting chemotaxis protein [Chengkuizengella axinellae]|uniref:Methyl-accepting chemotaxis protein n=1 Tax=Chengkuizengella axinellae TaxID=3064388 RepID=A0ABT9IVE7_9BACL|nr:methyl-accepting chemotaxis protein [Chengkuizengella sp. 2205SS18-9]MDP5273339.1 methyl-accepting chemotaxis protein [Chengkuizengella sp. 2205SS18-9]
MAKNIKKDTQDRSKYIRKKFNIHGIGTKINLLFFFSMVTTGLLLSIIITPYVSTKMEENIQNQSLMVAQTQLQSLQNYVLTTSEELNLMSDLLKNKSTEEINIGFSHLQGTSSKFIDIYQIDETGQEVLRSGFSSIMQDRSEDSSYIKVNNTGNYIGKIEESNYMMGPKFILEVSNSVTDLVNKPIGTIGTYLSLQSAWKEIRGNFEENQNQMFLISSDGYLVASDDEEHLALINQDGAVENTLEHEGVMDMIAKLETTEFSEINSMSGYGIFKDENGVSHVTSYVYDNQIGGAVFVETPVTVAFSAVSEIRNVIIIVVLSLLAAVTIIAFGFSNRLIKPLKKLISVSNRISKGDLTQTTNIKRKDEIGMLADSFDEMVYSLNQLVTNTKQASKLTLTTSEKLRLTVDEVAVASKQITAAIDEIAHSSEYQATISQETDDKIDQFMELATEIETQKNNVIEKAKHTQETINDNQSILENVIDGVQSLAESTDHSSKEVNILEERAFQIRKILETSKNIAKQTNLLSLNASIEAARAGTQGKGFAVVADEIRKLAVQSKEASDNVEEIINLVLDSISNVNNTMAYNIEQAHEERMAAEKAKTALLEIIESMDKVLLSINSMNNLLREQKSSVSSIQTNSKESSSYAMETTSSTEEVAASATETTSNMTTVIDRIDDLLSMSTELNQSVERFKVKEEN